MVFSLTLNNTHLNLPVVENIICNYGMIIFICYGNFKKTTICVDYVAYSLSTGKRLYVVQ